ncbi:MAG: hypothetical protein ACK56F_20350, partial [bacterium]
MSRAIGRTAQVQRSASTCSNGAMAAAKASASSWLHVPDRRSNASSLAALDPGSADPRRCNTRRFTLMPWRRASRLS